MTVEESILKALENGVRKAATVLDDYYPGWQYKINTDTLNIREPSVCILGQLPSRSDLYGRTDGRYTHHLTVLSGRPDFSAPVYSAFVRESAIQFWLPEIEKRRTSVLTSRNPLPPAPVVFSVAQRIMNRHRKILDGVRKILAKI